MSCVVQYKPHQVIPITSARVVRLEVLTALNIKIMVFCDMTPCRPEDPAASQTYSSTRLLCVSSLKTYVENIICNVLVLMSLYGTKIKGTSWSPPMDFED